MIRSKQQHSSFPLRRLIACLLLILIVWSSISADLLALSEPTIANISYTDLPDTGSQKTGQNKSITIQFQQLRDVKNGDYITLHFPQFIGGANIRQNLTTANGTHIATLERDSEAQSEGANWKITFNENAENFESIDELTVSFQDKLRDTFHRSGEPNIQINLPVYLQINGQVIDRTITKQVTYRTLKDYYAQGTFSTIYANETGGANLFVYPVFWWPDQETADNPLIVCEIAQGVTVPTSLIGKTYNANASVNKGTPVINGDGNIFWRTDLPDKKLPVKVVDVKTTASGTTRIHIQPLAPLINDTEYWIVHKDFYFSIVDSDLYSFDGIAQTTIENKMEIFFDGKINNSLTTTKPAYIGTSSGSTNAEEKPKPLGGFKFTKFDASTKQSITGATFHLTLDRLTNPEDYPTYKNLVGKVIRHNLAVDSNGILTQDKLPPGHYTLKEIKAPVNYYFSSFRYLSINLSLIRLSSDLGIIDKSSQPKSKVCSMVRFS